MVSKL